ncbi:hypothetical protein EJB05_52729, partial [Eragrostis curvula]
MDIGGCRILEPYGRDATVQALGKDYELPLRLLPHTNRCLLLGRLPPLQPQVTTIVQPSRKERHNLSSDFRTCFEALPANFNTSWALRVPSTGWNQHWQLHLRVSHVGFFSFILPVHFIRYNISLLQKIGLDEAEVPSHYFSDDD